MCFNKYKYKCIWYGNKERLTLVYRIIIDWSLQTNCIDILISSLLFDFNNDVLINSGVDQVRKLVKADKMAFIVLGFITRLPFREIAKASPLAMPRNDIKCVARNNVKKVCRFCYYFSANKLLLLSVRSTLSFWGATWGPQKILCTFGEKEYASIRQSIVACGNRLVKNEAYDASPGRDTK